MEKKNIIYGSLYNNGQLNILHSVHQANRKAYCINSSEHKIPSISVNKYRLMATSTYNKYPAAIFHGKLKP